MTRLNARQRRLVEQHLYLVTTIAKYVSRRLPDCVTLSELESVGNEALCNAAITHQARLGPFDHWARIKVNGAMFDANKGANYAKRYSQPGDPQFSLLTEERSTPESILIDRQARHSLNSQIAAAIAQLTKPEQRILEASDNDQTLGEIADELGVGITTVHRRREAIYAKLRYNLATLAPKRCAEDDDVLADPQTKRKCSHPTFRGSK